MAQTHRVALLGFGTVGKGFVEIIKKKSNLLKTKYNLGVEIVAVSDFMRGSVYCPDGLKLDELLEHDAAGKSLSDFAGTKSATVYKDWDGVRRCTYCASFVQPYYYDFFRKPTNARSLTLVT